KEEAKEAGLVLHQTPGQIFFIPSKDGKQMLQEEYEQQPLDIRKETEQKITQLEHKLEGVLVKTRVLEKEASEDVKHLDEQIVHSATASGMDQLKEKYNDSPKIKKYLKEVQKDIIENYQEFQLIDEPQQPAQLSVLSKEEDPFIKYKVNLFVNNEETMGAPTIIEPFTNYYNIFGKVEYKSQFTYTT